MIMYISAVGMALALLTFLFQGKLANHHNPNREAKAVQMNDEQVLILQKNRAGQYVAPGKINDFRTSFLLDTGATDVAVTPALAKAAGLTPGIAISVQTANGAAIAYRTRIAVISVAGLLAYDVSAAIVPALGGEEALLGMSFLERFEFTQRGTTLTLKKLHGPEP